ncbi:hypothetical protein Pla52o_57430 [Novipirellula galeiformis]|uniref:Uncharacterized protein n=1 Tax=Novipirellula galeiformis TaxID=2528004 RepID=A0A5C6BF73_9BACT|nr:hypothetical protein Pla52o_57430 [Novipirellula galeiformis]
MHVVVIGLCLQRRRPHHRITRPAASSLPRTSPRNNRPSNIEHGNRPSNVGLAFGPVGDRWRHVVRVKTATGDVANEFPFAGHSTTVSNHCKRNFEHPRSTAQLLCPVTFGLTGAERKINHFKKDAFEASASNPWLPEIWAFQCWHGTPRDVGDNSMHTLGNDPSFADASSVPPPQFIANIEIIIGSDAEDM